MVAPAAGVQYSHIMCSSKNMQIQQPFTLGNHWWYKVKNNWCIIRRAIMQHNAKEKDRQALVLERERERELAYLRTSVFPAYLGDNMAREAIEKTCQWTNRFRFYLPVHNDSRKDWFQYMRDVHLLSFVCHHSSYSSFRSVSSFHHFHRSYHQWICSRCPFLRHTHKATADPIQPHRHQAFPSLVLYSLF